MEFSQILGMMMKNRGWTGYRLAKEMSCSQSTIAHWLNGDSKPSRMSMRRLAEVLNVSEDVLHGKDTAPVDGESVMLFDPTLSEALSLLMDRPDRKALLDATRNMTPEQVEKITAMLDSF